MSVQGYKNIARMWFLCCWSSWLQLQWHQASNHQIGFVWKWWWTWLHFIFGLLELPFSSLHTVSTL